MGSPMTLAQYLASQQMPQHFGWGGAVADIPFGNAYTGQANMAATDARTLVSNPGALPGQVAGQVGNAASVGSLFGNIQGAFPGGVNGAGSGSLIPHDSFQATTPGINQGDSGNFQQAIANGLGNNVQNNFAGVQGAAGSQGALGAGLANFANTAAGQQQGLIAQLQTQANGGGAVNQATQNMFNQQAQANAAASASAAASQRGLNPALAARESAEGLASANQGAAQGAQNYNLAQTLGAQQQLGSILGSNISTGVNGATSNFAGQGQTLNAYGTGVSGAQNQQLGSAVTGQGNLNNAINTGSLGAQGINAGVSAGNAGNVTKLEGGLINGLAAGGASAVGKYDGGEIAGTSHLLAQGGPVPGTPQVDHNSPQNDTVPTMLTPKEIVLPLSVTQAPDAPARAAQFVDMLKEHTQPGYAKVLDARKKLQELEKRYQGGAA